MSWMPFLPANPWRTACRVALTVAILTLVVHDLCRVEPEVLGSAVTDNAVSAKKPVPSPRLAVQQLSAPLPPVCGNWVGPTNSIYDMQDQVQTIFLGGGCSPSPIITFPTPSTSAVLEAGAGLSFQEIQYSSEVAIGAQVPGLVVVNCSSWKPFVEAVLSTSLLPSPTLTVEYPLMNASQVVFLCDSLTDSNNGVILLPVKNCPVDKSLALVGSYNCTLRLVSGGQILSSARRSLHTESIAVYLTVLTGYATMLSVASYTIYAKSFTLSVVIEGPLILSSALLSIQLCRDCATFTSAKFASAIYGFTGIGPAAIEVVSTWGCNPMTVNFKVRGNSQQRINGAVALIMASAAPNGKLNAFLGITYAGPAQYFQPIVPCPTYTPFTSVVGPTPNEVDPHAGYVGLTALAAIPAVVVAAAVAAAVMAPAMTPAEAEAAALVEAANQGLYGPANTAPGAPTQGGFTSPGGPGGGSGVDVTRKGRHARHGGDTELASVPMYNTAPA